MEKLNKISKERCTTCKHNLAAYWKCRAGVGRPKDRDVYCFSCVLWEARSKDQIACMTA